MSLGRLSSRSLLILRGEATIPLLQGIVTKDVRMVTEKPSIASFILDTNGRIVDEILLKQVDDKFLLECSAVNRDSTKKLLERYRLRKKVSIDIAEESVLWSEEKVEGGIEDPRVPSIGYRLYAPSSSSVDDVTDRYRRLRWREGVSEGEEVKGMLPFNVNGDLLGQVSANKGCYVGQELTARTATQGMLRRRVVPITCEGQVSGEIRNEEGKKVGKVIVSDESHGLALLALSSVGNPLKVGTVPIQAHLPPWMKVCPDLSQVHLL